MTGKSNIAGKTTEGNKSNVATSIMNLMRKFAFAGKAVFKRGRCTASCKPFSIDHSWLRLVARIRLTMKFVMPIVAAEASDIYPLNSIASASAYEGIWRGTYLTTLA